jgi:hypothetical protein
LSRINCQDTLTVFQFSTIFSVIPGIGIIPMTNIGMNTRSEVTEVLQTLMEVKIQPYVSSVLVELSLESDDLHHPDS